MGLPTIATAQCMCSFGTNPSNLMVLPNNKVMVENKPVANIMDNKPMVNIMPFGNCTSLSNPQVSAATSAALGVLTPMPCIPVTNAPWTPGSPTVMLGTAPILNNSSKLMCNWGGVIQITNPGATKENVP